MDSYVTKEVDYRAIHRQVLLVYVANIATNVPEGGWPGDWKAYVVPVPGKNHDEEVALWRTEGTQLVEREARAMWPRMADHFDSLGLKWRK